MLLNDMQISFGIGGAILVHTASGLLGAISFSPGGLGTTEASAIGLLSLQKITFEDSINSTLLIRMMKIATVIGIFCLILPKKNFNE